MAELKTKVNSTNAEDFLQNLESAQKKNDSLTLLRLMKDITCEEPRMWGESIIGFGNYHYKYASGREGDWFITGFSPRKQNLTIYLMYGFEEQTELLDKLGKHKTGKACLYIKKLEDVDLNVLSELIQETVRNVK